MISKDALNNIGGYDERFVYAQDYKLMQDLFLQNYVIVLSDFHQLENH